MSYPMQIVDKANSTPNVDKPLYISQKRTKIAEFGIKIDKPVANSKSHNYIEINSTILIENPNPSFQIVRITVTQLDTQIKNSIEEEIYYTEQNLIVPEIYHNTDIPSKTCINLNFLLGGNKILKDSYYAYSLYVQTLLPNQVDNLNEPFVCNSVNFSATSYIKNII